MSSLKRKDAPGGHLPAKSAKKIKEGRQSKPDGPAKDTTKSPAAKTGDKSKPAVVSVLKDEEPLFPRGGGSILTPLEQKRIQIEAKADALREEEFNTGKKSTKKAKKAKAGAKGDKKKGKVTEEDFVKIESLGFKVRVFSLRSW
jgi:rRNA biogenesis protein RRP5